MKLLPADSVIIISLPENYFELENSFIYCLSAESEKR